MARVIKKIFSDRRGAALLLPVFLAAVLVNGIGAMLYSTGFRSAQDAEARDRSQVVAYLNQSAINAVSRTINVPNAFQLNSNVDPTHIIRLATAPALPANLTFEPAPAGTQGRGQFIYSMCDPADPTPAMLKSVYSTGAPSALYTGCSGRMTRVTVAVMDVTGYPYKLRVRASAVSDLDSVYGRASSVADAYIGAPTPPPSCEIVVDGASTINWSTATTVRMNVYGIVSNASMQATYLNTAVPGSGGTVLSRTYAWSPTEVRSEPLVMAPESSVRFTGSVTGVGGVVVACNPGPTQLLVAPLCGTAVRAAPGPYFNSVTVGWAAPVETSLHHSGRYATQGGEITVRNSSGAVLSYFNFAALGWPSPIARNVTGNWPGVYSVSGLVRGWGGTSCTPAPSSFTMTPPPVPTCSLSYNPNPAGQGNTVWVQGYTGGGPATEMYIDGVPVSLSNPQRTYPNVGSTFTVNGEIRGPGGNSACSLVVPVHPPPTCTLWASASTVEYGQPVNLAVIYTGGLVTGVNINGVGLAPTNPNWTTTPTATTSYVGTVAGPGGVNTCTGGPTVVNVNMPACRYNDTKFVEKVDLVYTRTSTGTTFNFNNVRIGFGLQATDGDHYRNVPKGPPIKGWCADWAIPPECWSHQTNLPGDTKCLINKRQGSCDRGDTIIVVRVNNMEADPLCNAEAVGLRKCEPLDGEGCGCFTGDTPILMGDGSWSPIERVRKGDVVLNPSTKKPQRVRNVIAGPEEKPIYIVSTFLGTVRVTETHPFPTQRGMLRAKDLKVGDELTNADGYVSPVTEIRTEMLPSNENVWNLELDSSQNPDEEHLVAAGGLVTGDLYIQNHLGRKKKK